MNFYAEYKVEGARGLSFAKQQEYSNNAAILEAFRKWIEKADSQRLRQSYPRIKKTEFWARAARALRRIGDKYPHSLPENPRRLQEKFNQFFQGGKPNYEMLVTGKFGTRRKSQPTNSSRSSSSCCPTTAISTTSRWSCSTTSSPNRCLGRRSPSRPSGVTGGNTPC